MLNRPEDLADPMAEDAADIGGHEYEPEPAAAPFWRRHPRALIAGAIGAGAIGAALVPVGPGAFAVAPGEGLVRLGVNYQMAIDLAEHCERPIYMGRVQNQEYRITYEVARQLESETDRTQVTVGGLQVGDVFNPRRNIYGVWVQNACPARLSDELLYG